MPEPTAAAAAEAVRCIPQSQRLPGCKQGECLEPTNGGSTSLYEPVGDVGTCQGSLSVERLHGITTRSAA